MAENYHLEKFNGVDFGFWKLQIKHYLNAKDLAVVLKEKKPEEMEDAEWEALDAKAMGLVFMTLSREVAHHTAKAKTTKEMMDVLAGLYEKPSGANKFHVVRRLFNFKMDEGASATRHLSEFGTILDQIESVNIKIDEELQAIALLQSLPESWSQTVTAVTAARGKEPYKLSEIKDLVVSEEVRRKESGIDSSGGSSGGSALSARSRFRGKPSDREKSRERGDMSQMRCWKCGGVGHLRKDCRRSTVNAATEDVVEDALFLSTDGDAVSRADGRDVRDAQKCMDYRAVLLGRSSSGGSAMSTVDNGAKRNEQRVQRVSRAGKFDSGTVRANGRRESWTLDSGASVHMCCDAGIMDGYTAGSFGKVYLGNGKALEVAGKGTAQIKDEKGSVLRVRDVRHVPGLRKNLLSVGQLDRDGCDVTFSCGNWKIVKGARVLARGRKHGTLYCVGTERVRTAGIGRSDAETWRRGGSNHGNQKRVSFMIEELKSGSTSTGPGT